MAPAVGLVNQGQYLEASEKVKLAMTEASEKDRLAYLLDQASALQMAGRYQESSRLFIQADQLSEQLDYHSASQVTLSALSSEEMIQYKGDSFEKLMINAMNALNFLYLDDLDSAMVEVRRIDEKVKRFQLDNRKDYELNSFASYLSGLIYEAQGKFDDAFISYKKSYELDPFPSLLLYDLNRVAKKSNRMDQLALLGPSANVPLQGGASRPPISSIYVDPHCVTANSVCADIVVVYLQGLGPKKVPMPQSPRYPTLIRTQSNIKAIKVTLSEEKKLKDHSPVLVNATSSPVYNVQDVAIETLEKDRAALVLRRLGGVVAKEVAADQIRQKNEALGFIAWLFMHLSDRADLRQWLLLPESIQVAKFKLLPKEYNLVIEGLDSRGIPLKTVLNQKLKLNNQKTQFKIIRTTY